jgi:hypothetical protein
LEQIRRKLLQTIKNNQTKYNHSISENMNYSHENEILAHKLLKCSKELKVCMKSNQELKNVIVDLNADNESYSNRVHRLTNTISNQDVQISKFRSFQHVALKESQIARGFAPVQIKKTSSYMRNHFTDDDDDDDDANDDTGDEVKEYQNQSPWPLKAIDSSTISKSLLEIKKGDDSEDDGISSSPSQ